MNAKIGIGLGKIVFGMSQEDVKKILGNPNKISEEEKDDGIVYQYFDMLIKLKFDKKEHLKLYSIEVHNPKVTMFNQKILNKTKKEILKMLDDRGYKDIEHEDYDLFETLFCEEIWTTFSLELDRLIYFEFSPLFKANEIVWPKRTQD